MDAKEITDALATVTDSYFKKDIITLGYVKGMTIGKDTLRFSLRLPAPLMPDHDELAQKCQDALKNVADIGKIEIKKDWEVQRLPSLNAPNTPNSLRGVKNIIAIASGKACFKFYTGMSDDHCRRCRKSQRCQFPRCGAGRSQPYRTG